jgi:tripartite-type tricarboxylate transporter receptor subunit TctC
VKRRTFVKSAAALVAAPMVARSQGTYPTKPLRLICAFPAGGTSDVMARRVGNGLAKELGQSVVVENLAGVGGTIGVTRALTYPADGYTIVQTGVGQSAVAHGLYPKLTYDSMRDFIHLNAVHTGPNVFLAHPSAPFNTFNEFIDYVHKNPGKLNYGYTHAASGHMAMELLRQTANLDMQGIPYKGGAPLFNDLLGGQIPIIFINQDMAHPQVKAGKLKALAVSSMQRNILFPEVPTINELGYKGFQALSWSGISALKGTPQPIVDKLEAALVKAMAAKEVKERMDAEGFVIPEQGGKAYTAFVKSEIDLWMRVIKTAGIKAE